MVENETYDRLHPDLFKPHKSRRREYLYIVQGAGRTKIGHTANLKKRLSNLETELPFSIDILLAKEYFGARVLEKRLHRKYKYKKVKGEWFELTEKDLKDINKLLGEVHEGYL